MESTSLLSPATIGPTTLPPFPVIVDLGISGPRGGHTGCRRIHAVVDKAQVLVFRNCLAKLAQHVIVHVPCFATAVEESSGVHVSCMAVLLGN